jgi:hypothetical protein
MKNLTTYDEFLNEKAKPPKLKTSDREANAVKGEATKTVIGSESKFKGVIQKIFNKVESEAKKEAKDKNVPYNKVPMDTITLKNPKSKK